MENTKLIIITAPSGSGKSTLIKKAMRHFPQIKFSISACTRQPRIGEINGSDYYFISIEEFKEKITKNQFIEWEMVYEGKYYGTLKKELSRIWDINQVPLMDIDVKGALKVIAQYPNNCLSIFIQPPSLEILEQRLINRGTETPNSLSERLKKAKTELEYATKFNHIIINDNLEVASQNFINLVRNFLN